MQLIVIISTNLLQITVHRKNRNDTSTFLRRKKIKTSNLHSFLTDILILPVFLRMWKGKVFSLVTRGGTQSLIPSPFGRENGEGYPSLWSLVLSKGYPRRGQGYPISRIGVPTLARIGYPPPAWIGYRPHCTEPGQLCGSGSMPLAFTQRDFLVFQMISVLSVSLSRKCLLFFHFILGQ